MKHLGKEAPSQERPAARGDNMGHSTYKSLVTTPTDMIGHVAYALYKRDKLLYCDRIQETEARTPGEEEIRAFIASSSIRLQQYRNEATTLLGEFATEAMRGQMEEEAAQLEDDYNARVKAVKADYEAKLIARDPFFSSVWRSVVGNLATLLLTAAFIFGLAMTKKNGFTELMSTFGWEPTQAEEKAP